MLRRLASAAAAALVLAAAPAAAKDMAKKVILNTETYPPYQYEVAGELDGENVKVLRELFKRARIPVDFKLAKWKASYAAARDNASQGVFTAARTPDREALFKWVGPISVSRWVLLAKKSKAIKIAKLEDTFQYKIGGYKNDAKTLYLEGAGAQVDKVDDDAQNADRLESGAIDLWATGYVSGMYYADKRGIKDLEEVFVLREEFGYLAMNLDTDASVILDLNRVLEKMKDEGLLNATLKFKK